MYENVIGDIVKLSRVNTVKAYKIIKEFENSTEKDADKLGVDILRNYVDLCNINYKLLDILKHLDGIEGTYKIVDASEDSKQLTDYNERIERLLDIVERNIKSITVSEQMRKNPGRHKEISDEIIKSKYLVEHKSATVIANELGMTMAGVKNRLESLRVYKGVKSDYGNKRDKH